MKETRLKTYGNYITWDLKVIMVSPSIVICRRTPLKKGFSTNKLTKKVIKSVLERRFLVCLHRLNCSGVVNPERNRGNWENLPLEYLKQNYFTFFIYVLMKDLTLSITFDFNNTYKCTKTYEVRTINDTLLHWI